MPDNQMPEHDDPVIQTILDAPDKAVPGAALSALEVTAKQLLRDLGQIAFKQGLPADKLALIAQLQEGLSTAFQAAATGDQSAVKSYTLQLQAAKHALELDLDRARVFAVDRVISIGLAVLVRLAAGN